MRRLFRRQLPDATTFIQALPLTPVDALRAVVRAGAVLAVRDELVLLAGWSVKAPRHVRSAGADADGNLQFPSI